MADPRKFQREVIPSPGARYDRLNEAAFRSVVMRFMAQVSTALTDLAAQVNPSGRYLLEDGTGGLVWEDGAGALLEGSTT